MRGRVARSAFALTSAGLVVLGLAGCSQSAPEQDSGDSDLSIVEQVQIDENEFGAFYAANKERYASLGENKEALQNQVVQDLRDAKAAPLFDRYIEQLRQRHAAIVAVNDELLGEFVSRRRQAKSPVDL